MNGLIESNNQYIHKRQKSSLLYIISQYSSVYKCLISLSLYFYIHGIGLLSKGGIFEDAQKK